MPTKIYSHWKAETKTYELIRKSVGMQTICSIAEFESREELHWPGMLPKDSVESDISSFSDRTLKLIVE